jgi:hypothetical protein
MAITAPSQRLRVVGQEFEKNKVSDFEVFLQADGCQARGTVPPQPVEAPPQPSRKWSLRRLFKSETEDVEPEIAEAVSQSETWERTYTWSELDQLDQEYRIQRSGSGTTPNDYATSQILRVVGAYAERKHWTLMSVALAHQFLKIQYREPDGRLETASHKYAELYDFSFQLYKSRKADSAEQR